MFPLIGGIVFAVGLFFKNEPIKRTSFFIILLGGISTALAMFSGEGAEEIAEKIPGITKKLPKFLPY
jgi:sulfite exporter TauE/SafE